MSKIEVKGIADSDYREGMFPVILECATPSATLTETVNWIAANQDAIRTRLSDCGALLLRGFPIVTAQDFDDVIASFQYETFTYEESLSNAVRVNRTPRVFTANEAPPSEGIFLHNEMAQTPIYPTRLFFFCEQAAATQGETSLCPCDQLYDRLKTVDPDFVRDLEAKGVKYTNVMPNGDNPLSGQGRGWQTTLGAKDRAGAEARLAELGYSWTWLEDGSVGATSKALPAIKHLDSGKSVFFNQLIAAYQGWGDVSHLGQKIICFGDGSDITDAQMQTVIREADALIYDVPWQNGDVALVDNYMAMHGRRPFTGTRKVLASFATENGIPEAAE